MTEEIKNMADRLGLSYSPEDSVDDQLRSIASQLGMRNFYNNSFDRRKLYDALLDMCDEYGIPSDIVTTPYDPNTEPDYVERYNRGEIPKKGEDEDKKDEDEEEEDKEDNEESSEDNKENEEKESSESSDGDSSPGDNGYGNVEEVPVDENGNPIADHQGVNYGQNGENPTEEAPHHDLEKEKEDEEKEKEKEDKPESDKSSGSGESTTSGNIPGTTEGSGYNSTLESRAQANQNSQAGVGPLNPPNTAEKAAKEGTNAQAAATAAGAGGSVGNGYGALKNRNINTTASNNSDVTNNARKNMQHNYQSGSNNAKPFTNASEGRARGKDPNSGNGGLLSNLGSKIKNRLRGGGDKKPSGLAKATTDAQKAGKASLAKKSAKGKLLLFIKSHPYVFFIAICVLLLFFIIMALFMIFSLKNLFGDGNIDDDSCDYTLYGVVSQGPVELNDVKVEIVTCDATPEDYSVIETVNLEKYALGVALGENGWDSEVPEMFKAIVVSARGFALRRNSTMCPDDLDDCFYGYNPQTKTIRLRNCGNDQIYCDPDTDCYVAPNPNGYGEPVYGKEAEGLPGSGVWRKKLDDEEREKAISAAQTVEGEVLVDTDGKVINTVYDESFYEDWYNAALDGKTYEDILMDHYEFLKASKLTSAKCSSGNVNYFDYSLNSDGNYILNEPLESFLQEKGTSLASFNQLITDHVNESGHGTRAGVVAAAVTLIGELGDKYGVVVPYYWGGGHADGVALGALGYWGSTECQTYANGQSYNYCGLDCSGFVPWAIKNGGFNMAQKLAGEFFLTPGAEKVELNANTAVLLPGDLLESPYHIILVVAIDKENRQYICAEAMGNEYGVTFSRRSFSEEGYWGVNMSGYYNDAANVWRN